MTIELSQSEFAALEPAMPQFQGFGDPVNTRIPRNTQPSRETTPNLLGIQFPWVDGRARIEASGAKKALACRLRYDGDFTYTLAATGPKRPMFIQFTENERFEDTAALRLHAMQFDATLLREQIASQVYTSLNVPSPRTAYVELSMQVDNMAPRLVGLYTALESIDGNFLVRHGIAGSSLLMKTNGLSSIADIGDEWTAYAPLFRGARTASQHEQARIIDFAKLVGAASDEEFQEKIQSFIDSDSFLRYLAATAVTSNLTGFSNIGLSDYLCLDSATGKFRFIAGEFETALGGAVFSGTPEQLIELSVLHPYAGECKLIERLFAMKNIEAAYRKLLQETIATTLDDTELSKMVAAIADPSAEERAIETKAIEERMRQASSTFGGGFGGGGFGGPPLSTQPLLPLPFLTQRKAAIAKQLSEGAGGYIPSPPNFNAGGGFGGGFGGGPGSGFGGGARQGAQQPISEAEFRESVQVPKDYKATLFAKSPEVSYPVAIAAEPAGAIYVASDQQGSLGTDKNGGKILRCVDANNDGVMDSVTTFCSVDHVRGVVYRNGSVWVCHPPYLTVFHDDDADGVADRQQQLVSGLTSELVNTRGGDHTTNGIRMGIDGWIYIGDGDYGVPEAKGIDGSTVVLRGGGILRVRPDGRELELFCSGLRNPFDIAIDPQLNMFTRDNTNDGGGWDTRVSQLFQSAEYGYPRLFANFSDEIMPTLGVYGGGGGTGSLYIEDERWLAGYNRSLFTGDWGRSAVFHHPLQAEGATFAITQEPFAAIPRATGMDIDAQGNLYIASWWSGEASVYVGPHVGFVTRLTPRAAEERPFPNLHELTGAELTELLRAASAVIRFHAQGEFIQRSTGQENLDALTQIVKDRQFPVSGRVAAMFALKQILGESSHQLLIAATEDPDLRELAIRALTDRKSQLAKLNSESLARFLDDESHRVRVQTLISLGRLGDISVANAIIPLADTSGTSRPDPAKPHADQVIPHLAMKALVQLGAVDACLDAIEGEHWRGALRVLRSLHSPAAVDRLVKRLNSEQSEERRAEILVTLMRLYQYETPYDGSWWGIRPDTTGPYYDPMKWEKSDEIQSVLVTALQEADAATATRLIQELERHQVQLSGTPTPSTSMASADAQPISIQPVDPQNPNQVGNLSYEEALARTLAIQGNAERGAAIFTARSCNACHTAKSGEKPIGPHLVDIGKRYHANELIESIVQPGAKIAQGYETQVLLLDDGQVLAGFVISENGRHVILRDSGGLSHTIERDSIEERKRQQNSAMPEGLVSSLEIESLANLIAYLQSL